MATAPNPTPENPNDKPAPKAKILRLKAVHGDIVHPTDATVFTVDSSKKHELDGWVKMQLDAGKLAEDSDE